jgi:hypothetical protein
MLIHAVDIGASKERATCGIAELDSLKMHTLLEGGDDLIATRTIGGHELMQVLAAVQHAAACGATMVVENPYFSTKFGNPKTFETLIVVRQRFVDLCSIYKVPCRVLYPAQWQVILKHVPVGAAVVTKKSEKLTKKQAEWLVSTIYGERLAGRTEHEKDAALMGRWWGFTHGT